MLKYNESEHKIICETDGNCSEIVFLYDDKSSDGKLFDISLFSNYCFIELYNTVIKEEHILEIKIEERIGMIVPFISIINCVSTPFIRTLHSWYLFLATAYYLTKKDDIDSDSDSGIKCFVILEKAKIESECVKDTELIEWALMSDNYYSKPKKNNSLLKSISKKGISLKLISLYLRENTYIREYFRNYIYEPDTIKRFLYSYQIIELLLDDVLIEAFHNNILNCRDGNLSLRSVNTEGLTENSRLNTILDKIGRKSNSEFDAACKDFLKLAGRNTDKLGSFPDSLYQVRNYIVHRLRFIVNSPLEKGLTTINDYFELFIFSIVESYNKNSKIDMENRFWFYKTIKEYI